MKKVITRTENFYTLLYVSQKIATTLFSYYGTEKLKLTNHESKKCFARYYP